VSIMEIRIETIESMKKDIENQNYDIKELREENKEFRREINDLQRRTSLNERDIHSGIERLRKIDSNTTWILRLIIGTIAAGIIGYFFKFQ